MKGSECWHLEEDHIIRLLGPEARKQNLIKGIDSLIASIENPSQATVYFYFSGHGVDNALVPYDAKGDDQSSFLSYAWIRKQFDAAGIANKVFFLDTCHAGSMLEQKGGSTTIDFDDLYRLASQSRQTNGYTIFAAVDAFSAASGGVYTSVYTTTLLKGLRCRQGECADLDADGIIKAGELKTYLVTALSTSQLPIYVGNDRFPIALRTGYKTPQAATHALSPKELLEVGNLSFDKQDYPSAFTSYSKVLELDGVSGQVGREIPGKMDALYARLINAGIESYNNKNYAGAVPKYELASRIKPQDTTAVLYLAYAQEAGQDMLGAKKSYLKLLDMNCKSEVLYTRLLYACRQTKDEGEAIRVVQQARIVYPTNHAFFLEELNAYINSGKAREEVINKVKEAISAEPNNDNIYAVLGSLYDQNKQRELAVAAYEQALKLNPNNFDSLYNMGIYNYNSAATLRTNESKLNQQEYQASGKKMELEARLFFEKALSYFQKALAVKPDDADTAKALQKTYTYLGRLGDAARLKAQSR